MDGLIKITFLGDLMCKMQQVRAVRIAHADYKDIFASVKHLWKDSDFVVANLETPVTGPCCRTVYEEMRFNAPVAFLRAVHDSGINFVTTANNHILDRGLRGLCATLRQIREMGLGTTGAYDSKDESELPYIKEINGVRFAFVACTYDTNPTTRGSILRDKDRWRVDYLHLPTPYEASLFFEIARFVKNLIPYGLRQGLKNWYHRGRSMSFRPQADAFPLADYENGENRLFMERVLAKVRRAKEMADVVIALPHMGGQYNSEPGAWQLKVTDALIAVGADVVITNHAHTPLLVEERNGAFCAHALGNFCFTPGVGFYNSECQADYSLVLNCYFDPKTRKMVRKGFHLTKSVVLPNGVAVVDLLNKNDVSAAEKIIQRVRPGSEIIPEFNEENEL